MPFVITDQGLKILSMIWHIQFHFPPFMSYGFEWRVYAIKN